MVVQVIMIAHTGPLRQAAEENTEPLNRDLTFLEQNPAPTARPMGKAFLDELLGSPKPKVMIGFLAEESRLKREELVKHIKSMTAVPTQRLLSLAGKKAHDSSGAKLIWTDEGAREPTPSERPLGSHETSHAERLLPNKTAIPPPSAEVKSEGHENVGKVKEGCSAHAAPSVTSSSTPALPHAEGLDISEAEETANSSDAQKRAMLQLVNEENLQREVAERAKQVAYATRRAISYEPLVVSGRPGPVSENGTLCEGEEEVVSDSAPMSTSTPCSMGNFEEWEIEQEEAMQGTSSPSHSRRVSEDGDRPSLRTESAAMSPGAEEAYGFETDAQSPALETLASLGSRGMRLTANDREPSGLLLQRGGLKGASHALMQESSACASSGASVQAGSDIRGKLELRNGKTAISRKSHEEGHMLSRDVGGFGAVCQEGLSACEILRKESLHPAVHAAQRGVPEVSSAAVRASEGNEAASLSTALLPMLPILPALDDSLRQERTGASTTRESEEPLLVCEIEAVDGALQQNPQAAEPEVSSLGFPQQVEQGSRALHIMTGTGVVVQVAEAIYSEQGKSENTQRNLPDAQSSTPSLHEVVEEKRTEGKRRGLMVSVPSGVSLDSIGSSEEIRASPPVEAQSNRENKVLAETPCDFETPHDSEARQRHKGLPDGPCENRQDSVDSSASHGETAAARNATASLGANIQTANPRSERSGDSKGGRRTPTLVESRNGSKSEQWTTFAPTDPLKVPTRAAHSPKLNYMPHSPATPCVEVTPRVASRLSGKGAEGLLSGSALAVNSPRSSSSGTSKTSPSTRTPRGHGRRSSSSSRSSRHSFIPPLESSNQAQVPSQVGEGKVGNGSEGGTTTVVGKMLQAVWTPKVMNEALPTKQHQEKHEKEGKRGSTRVQKGKKGGAAQGFFLASLRAGAALVSLVDDSSESGEDDASSYESSESASEEGLNDSDREDGGEEAPLLPVHWGGSRRSAKPSNEQQAQKERAAKMAATLAEEKAAVEAVRAVGKERKALLLRLDSEHDSFFRETAAVSEAQAGKIAEMRRRVEEKGWDVVVVIDPPTPQGDGVRSTVSLTPRRRAERIVELETENSAHRPALAAARRELDLEIERVTEARAQETALETACEQLQQESMEIGNKVRRRRGTEISWSERAKGRSLGREFYSEEQRRWEDRMVEVEDKVARLGVQIEKRQRIAGELREKVTAVRMAEGQPSALELSLQSRLRQAIEHLSIKRCQVSALANERAVLAERLESVVTAFHDESARATHSSNFIARSARHNVREYSDFSDESDLRLPKRCSSLTLTRTRNVSHFEEDPESLSGPQEKAAILPRAVSLALSIDQWLVGWAGSQRNQNFVRVGLLAYFFLLHVWIVFIFRLFMNL